MTESGSTLMQRYSTALLRGVVEEANAVAPLEHRFAKGRLREVFVTRVLRHFLTSQFGVGSGIIINQAGDQSNEHDVIIYDTRILPPFITGGGLGVYPIEAVVAAIEVKSILNSKALCDADNAANKLVELCRGSIYPDQAKFAPSVAAVGFRSDDLACRPGISHAPESWLCANVSRIWAICVVGEFSWLNLSGWQCEQENGELEETKRFLSVFIDNIRTSAETRYQQLSTSHRDWLSVYLRKNSSGAASLRGEEVNIQVSSSTTTSTTTTTTQPPNCEDIQSM